jgi:hypothetical protein
MVKMRWGRAGSIYFTRYPPISLLKIHATTSPISKFEAMKLENVLFAVADGVVAKVLAKEGESLSVDQAIVEFV